MSLPKSVRSQAQMAAQHFEKPENPEEEVATTEPPAPEDPPKEEAANPEPSDATPTTGEEPAKPGKDEPHEEERDARYWRHRHDVMAGKYNAEVPALHQQVRELKQTIADRDHELETLKAQATPATPDSGLTDEQIAEFRETYGEELVDFVDRMIRQRVPATPAEPANDRVEQLDQRLSQYEQERQADREAQFWTDLEEAVPNYMTINADPGFRQFLAQFDPTTGKWRQAMLSEAQQRLDGQGVADLFKLYLEQAKPEPETRREVPEEDVAPRVARTTDPAPQGGGKRIWTGSDITAFYKDKAAGRISGDEAQRLEADIFAAQREGRVRQ